MGSSEIISNDGRRVSQLQEIILHLHQTCIALRQTGKMRTTTSFPLLLALWDSQTLLNLSYGRVGNMPQEHCLHSPIASKAGLSHSSLLNATPPPFSLVLQRGASVQHGCGFSLGVEQAMQLLLSLAHAMFNSRIRHIHGRKVYHKGIKHKEIDIDIII